MAQRGCCVSRWVSEGLRGHVTFEPSPGMRERALQASGRRAWRAGGQQAEGGSSAGQEKVRPGWRLELLNRGQVLGTEDRGRRPGHRGL